MKTNPVMNSLPPLMAIPLESRGVIALTGADAKTLVQSIITNDIRKLSPNQPIYAGLLTPQGKYLHDFIIAEADDTLYFDCEGERKADLIRRFMMYRLRAKVEIQDKSDTLAVVAVIGAGQLPAGLPEGAIAYRDPRHDSIGFRIILPRELIAGLPIPQGDFSHYERQRLALGLPDASRDFEIDRTLILEGNMEEMHGVDFNKGCYVGQELTARTKHRGKVRKRLLAVVIDGPAPAPGLPVMDGDREIGSMRSSFENRGIALLRIEDLSPGKAYACGEALITPVLPEGLKLTEPQA
jgi:folate-binding protein YgfZ